MALEFAASSGAHSGGNNYTRSKYHESLKSSSSNKAHNSARDSAEISPLLLEFSEATAAINKNSQKRRRSLRRKTSESRYDKDKVGRYYFADLEKFHELLSTYNQKEESIERGPFECMGKVNVTMRMCSVCGDAGKDRTKKDKYYVKKLEVAQVRTILCHGCLGERLRKMELSETQHAMKLLGRMCSVKAPSLTPKTSSLPPSPLIYSRAQRELAE